MSPTEPVGDREDPDSEPASERPRVPWPELHAAGVVGGWAALAGLGVALGSRLDRWSVTPFVALLYGAALGAVVASVAARRGGRPRGAVARRLLWVLVTLLLLWVWFPPMAYPVGWVYRHVALLFLAPP